MRLTVCCPGLQGLPATGAHARCDMGGCVVPSRSACRIEHAAIQQFWEPTQPVVFLGDLDTDAREEPETNHPYDWFEPLDGVVLALMFTGAAAGIAVGIYRTGLYRAIPFF